MVKEVILLLLIAHFLGDYYFQPDSFVRNQTTQKVAAHALVYGLTMLISIVPIFNRKILIGAIIIGLSHFIIDSVKFWLKKNKSLSYSQQILIYIIDQLLHILIILIIVIFLTLRNSQIEYLPFLERFIQEFNLNSEQILSWILILLIIYKPSSITIRTVLNYFEPDSKKEEDIGMPNAGALIGVFERLIILMMLSQSQYTAIGFVLTAKSVARYNRISEEPMFAEYYLLGTLLSSLLVIMSYLLIF